MTKLTKAQEKRFDEKFEGFFKKPSDYDVVGVNKSVKQHIADELARQKEKFDANLVYIQQAMFEDREIQKKDLVERLEKAIWREENGKVIFSRKRLDQAIETINGR